MLFVRDLPPLIFNLLTFKLFGYKIKINNTV